MQVRDIPKMSVTDLVSSLGGALNLWSGITAVVAVEILELLYFSCRDMLQKGGRQKDAQKLESKHTNA